MGVSKETILTLRSLGQAAERVQVPAEVSQCETLYRFARDAYAQLQLTSLEALQEVMTELGTGSNPSDERLHVKTKQGRDGPDLFSEDGELHTSSLRDERFTLPITPISPPTTSTIHPSSVIIDPSEVCRLRSNCLVLYISSAAQLGLSQELYFLSHKLTTAAPHDAVGWYCVAAYYWVNRRLDLAHKYLRRALRKNKEFVAAWILLGHVLSAIEEGEQALGVYRTAVRLLPTHTLPQLCIGREFLRTNSLMLATHTLTIALDSLNESVHRQPSTLLGADTHSVRVALFNELGVVYLRMNKISTACDVLGSGVALLKKVELQTSLNEPDHKVSANVPELYFNYATALRREGRFEEALEWYRRCLSVAPLKCVTLSFIGFTLHLMRRFDEAITHYHQALSLDPRHSFSHEMLQYAMRDSMTVEPLN